MLCPDQGFTSSHTILIDVTKYGGGGIIEKRLEEANIIINRNLLPWDLREGRHYVNPGGIRLGVSEVTRLGMREGEMKEVADFITRVVVDGISPTRVAVEVQEFKKRFTKLHYAFDSMDEAYEYIRIRGNPPSSG